METIGQTLRVARELKKTTLEDGSRVTKIKVEILQRLEGDDFTGLGAPMYVKGYLKLYAEYLGLDSKLMGDTYLQSQGGLRRQGLRLETEAALMAERQKRMHLPVGVIIGVASVLSAALLAWWSIRQWRLHHESPAHIATVPAPVAKVPVLPPAGFDPIYHPKKQPVAEALDK